MQAPSLQNRPSWLGEQPGTWHGLLVYEKWKQSLGSRWEAGLWIGCPEYCVRELFFPLKLQPKVMEADKRIFSHVVGH